MPPKFIRCPQCGNQFWAERPNRQKHCSVACHSASRRGKIKEPLEQRLWRRVDRSGDCWEWTGSVNDFGYGLLNVNGRADRAHRVAWRLTNGPIPAGMCVLHRCDNPRCVRPDHLFLGTRRDNNRDRAAKGRNKPIEQAARGERHGMAGLTADQVLAIRAEYANGRTTREIADARGLSLANVYQVVTRRTWKHLA